MTEIDVVEKATTNTIASTITYVFILKCESIYFFWGAKMIKSSMLSRTREADYLNQSYLC